MAGKNISEMSFDEFFFGKKERRRREPAEKPPEKPSEKPQATEKEVKPVADGSGFKRGRPKLNIRGNRVMLYVPAYEIKGAKLETAVVQGEKTIILGNLRISMLDSGGYSLPTEFDLIGAGVFPLDSFLLQIDGKTVYEAYKRGSAMFDADGMPIGRPEDTTLILRPSNRYLKLSDARVVTTVELEGCAIDTVEVEPGGGVRVTDTPPPKAAEEKTVTQPKVTKAKLSGKIVMPAPEQSATVKSKNGLLPLYASMPEIRFSVTGDKGEFSVKAKTSAGQSEFPIEEFGLKDVVGEVGISLIAGNKTVDKVRFFVLPGFSCSYDGRGDLPESDIVTYTVGEERFSRSIYDGEETVVRYEKIRPTVCWNIPAVTVDFGKGPVPLGDDTVSLDELSESISIVARGVSKKTVFLAGAGKKVDITPDWEGDEIRIDAEKIGNAVLDSPSKSAKLFITVNSCPVRKFLTVVNPSSSSISYSAGEVTVSVSGSAEYELRVYNIDKSVDKHGIQSGVTKVTVGFGAIVAEVAEIRSGKEISVESVSIRELPFILGDSMGNVWFYVTKDKRIPIPSGLVGGTDADIRKWHSQIVRMNPELRQVLPEKTVKAFKDFLA